MLMTHFIWQTVLKPLSVTNAKNGEQSPFLAYRGYKQVMQGVTKQVSWWGGVYSVLGTLWMPLFGESFLTVTEVIFVRAQVFTIVL